MRGGVGAEVGDVELGSLALLDWCRRDGREENGRDGCEVLHFYDMLDIPGSLKVMGVMKNNFMG
jgi:hypothetical protein